MRKAMGLSALCCAVQWMLPRPTDIMSLRLDNTERQTVELSDAVLSSTRYMASWLRQRSWTLPQNRQALPCVGSLSKYVVCIMTECTLVLG